MKDIIITMPAHIVESVLANPEDYFFFHRAGRGRPKAHDVGGRVFFVWNGFVRGFGRTHSIRQLGQVVSLDGRTFQPGWYLKIYPDTWHWITPIPMRGFQGFRYSKLYEDQIEIVGTYLDKQPADRL